MMRGSTHIVAALVVVGLETARLYIHRTHLLGKQVDTVELTVFVGLRLEKLRKGSGKAYGHHHDTVVFGLAEQLTVELVAVETLLGIERTLEARVALGILHLADGVVGDVASRMLHAVALQPHGNVGMAVVGVQDVHHAGIVLSLAVNDHTLEVYQSVVDVVVEHHQGKKVVGGTAEVGIKNNIYRLRLASFA